MLPGGWLDRLGNQPARWMAADVVAVRRRPNRIPPTGRLASRRPRAA